MQTTGAALARRGETVLIVEDEAGLRELEVEALTGRGYGVLQAASGGQALELARQHAGRIHLAITDLTMPGMTGVEFADRIRAFLPYIPVLFTSGYDGDHIERVAAGRAAFLHKPFTLSSLAGVVRSLIDASDADLADLNLSEGSHAA